MKYHITHLTHYHYAEPVSISHSIAHLKPRRTERQRLGYCDLVVEPLPSSRFERIDYFGNEAVYFSIQAPHQTLNVISRTEVEVSPSPPPDLAQDRPWELVRDEIWSGRHKNLEAFEYTLDSPGVRSSSDLREYAAESFKPGCGLVAGALDLMIRIFHDFTFDTSTTTISTPLSEVLAARRGVCQDFAHLGVGCLRSLGLPARYVSGYLRTIPPAGKPRLVGADASHAWLSLFVPFSGWLDLDPTNNQVVSDDHITLAWGRDYSEVSPIRGVILGGRGQSVSIAVDVEAL
jgi:transglutaminase-like putative cysteine protease